MMVVTIISPDINNPMWLTGLKAPTNQLTDNDTGDDNDDVLNVADPLDRGEGRAHAHRMADQ